MRYYYGLGVGHTYAHCSRDDDVTTAANESQTLLDDEDDGDGDKDDSGAVDLESDLDSDDGWTEESNNGSMNGGAYDEGDSDDDEFWAMEEMYGSMY